MHLHLMISVQNEEENKRNRMRKLNPIFESSHLGNAQNDFTI